MQERHAYLRRMILAQKGLCEPHLSRLTTTTPYVQRVLHDRRKVYDLLIANDIDVPVHAYMERSVT